MAESWLCQEVERIIDRVTTLERALDRIGVFDSEGTLRGATWEVSNKRIASWRADTPLPLGESGFYTQIRQGNLTIKGGMFDISTGASGARMHMDGNALVGYNAAGQITLKMDWGYGSFWTNKGGFGGTLAKPRILLNEDGSARIGGWDINEATLSRNNLILDSAGSLRTSDFITDRKGWSISPEVAEFQNIVARGEIRSSVFVKGLIEAHAGELVVSRSAGVLAEDLYIGANDLDPNSYLYLRNPPGGGFLLSTAGYGHCWIRGVTPTGILETWFDVSNAVDMGDGTQRYEVDWRSGSRPATYEKGTPLVFYGDEGEGTLHMKADGTNAPYYESRWHGSAPWSTTYPHGERVMTRMGNLAGS